MRRHFSSLSVWAAPVLLLFAILSFGLLIPSLGFYWDDWAKILVARLWGLSHYAGYYAGDRPLSAWTHMLFTPLLGYRPAAWQVLNLALRWLSAWVFYRILDAVWPSALRQNLTAALLFLLYPVFTQQPAAVTFFQQWLQYALFFGSLWAMLVAAASTGWRARGWTAAALAAMLLHLSVTEYFVPVELVRPVLLWLFFANRAQPPAEPWQRQVLRVLTAWGPYLAGLAAYVIWRLFFLDLSGKDPYQVTTLYAFLQSPIATLVSVLKIMLVDTWQVVVGCWRDLLVLQLDPLLPFNLLAVGLGAGAGVLAVVVLLRRAEPDEAGRSRWLRQALGFAVAAVLLGPVPAWITGRQVVFDFHSNRYAMPAMFGAGLLWVVIIEWLAQRRIQRAVLAGVLVALAVGLHLRAANEYRWIWTAQQRVYWQLAWRAPGLQPGTALFFETEPFPDQGLFSTSAAINLMYPQSANQPVDPSTGEPMLAYWVYTLSPRYHDAPESYTIGLSTQFRTLKFSGSTPDSLLLFNDTQAANCLWVLDPQDEEHPYLSDLTRVFLPISNPERILPDAAPGYPPQEILGPEPEHGWCYYFEKADLARQMQDWDEVVRLGDTALELGYTPDKSGSNSPYEWMPFIEGYAHSGRWEQAASLTEAAFEKDASYGAMLCNLWSAKIGAREKDEGARLAWQAVGSAMQCLPTAQ